MQRLQPHPSKARGAADDHYTGLLDAARKIYARDGLAGFFAAVLPDTAKTVADAFLFFLFYNYLRTRRLALHAARGRTGSSSGSGATLPALDELSLGAAAGALSKLLTTPLSNVATRAQTSRSGASVRELAAQIRAEKGVLRGFWAGYSATLVLTLNPALTFAFYAALKRVLLPRARREEPGARATFLLAALSKAAASGITYPFALAKARAQAAGGGGGKREAKADVGRGTTHAARAAKRAGGRKELRTASDASVFATVLRVYREEGVAALYVGLGAEVLKGFFGHGITMLAKAQVHGWVVRAYFALLGAWRRLDPGAEAERVAREAREAYERAAGGVGKAARGVAEVVGGGTVVAGGLGELGGVDGNAEGLVGGVGSMEHMKRMEMLRDKKGGGD